MTDAERMAAIRGRQRGRTYSEKSVEREDEFMLRQLDARDAVIEKLRHPPPERVKGDAPDLITRLRERAGAAEARVAELQKKMNDAEATCDSYASENQRFHDRFTAAEARVAVLRPALLLLLDQVDYTHGKCDMAELVGAVLPIGVIEICRAALAPFDNPSTPSTRAQDEGSGEPPR